MDLTRREAIRWLTALVGGSLSTPALSAVVSGCRAEPGGTPRALAAGPFRLLELLVDEIIPPTDTPGAKDAGVAVFIDRLLEGWVDAPDRERFVTGLMAIDEDARQAYGTTFRDGTPEQRRTFLARLDEDAVRARAERVDPLPFFATLKEWTLVGYYTSQAGATQELQWLAAPGRYEGDLPLDEVGPTWA